MSEKIPGGPEGEIEILERSFEDYISATNEFRQHYEKLQDVIRVAEGSDNKMIAEAEILEETRSTKEKASLTIARSELEKSDLKKCLESAKQIFEMGHPLDQAVRLINAYKDQIEAFTRSMMAEDNLLIYHSNYLIKSILAIDPNFNLGGSSETKEDKRRNELNSWVAELGIPGLAIGEAKEHVRPRGAEALGIYINNEYKGDVFSMPPFNFEKKSLQDEITKLLGLRMEVGSLKTKILCSPEAQMVMTANGMNIRGETLFLNRDRNYPQIDLYNGGENARIEFSPGPQENEVTVRITEKAGEVIQYIFANGRFDLSSRRVL